MNNRKLNLKKVRWILWALLISCFIYICPAGAQTDAEVDYCNIPNCSNLIPGPLYTESFENSMRELYTKIPLIGGNPDNLDLDFDGMKDTAQARLFDTIMESFSLIGGIPTRNCIYWAYVGNRLKVEALALAIQAGWPSYLGTPPDLEGMKTFFAALATMGNTAIINTILSALNWIIPDLPDLSLLELDGSNIVYLNAKGDADLDGVCNIGEYKAWVLNTPADFDAFVNAAINSSITDYYGGCPACGTEGAVEGEGEGGGPPPCNMRSDENYFALLVMFGDTNGDGKLTKNELKAFVTGFLLDLGWWLIDKDGDGFMSFDEFVASNRLGGLLPANLDSNGDNQVTLTEIRQLSSKITQDQFNQHDVDGNGYLDCIDIMGPLPESCYAEWCWDTCNQTAVSAGFETALRSLYGLATWLGLNPDTADIDGNGMYDVAQARLLDYILAHPELPVFCCVKNAYMNNRVVAQGKWESIPLIGQVFTPTTFINVIAGVLTTGEQSLINSVVSIIDTLLFWTTFTLNEYDLTAGQYLTSAGDPDFDGVCNVGEYKAYVSAPTDIDTFILASLDINQAVNGGGCPLCPGTYEGEPPCNIEDITHYYYILIMFGDTDGNGLLSKEELKAITGWSDTALSLWGLVDTNGDNQLSLEEFSKVEWLYNLLPGLDGNNDGALTLIELQNLNSNITVDQLNAVDLNQNGALDCEDFVFAEGEGVIEGTPEGTPEGIPEGTPEGTPEGEGAVEGTPEGTPEGIPEGTPEGIPEGEGVIEGIPEGTPEGVVEGEPPTCDIDDIEHYFLLMLIFGDTNGDGLLSKSEFKALTGWSDWMISLYWYVVDKNRDNQLSYEEFTTVSTIFNLLPKLDSNGDNVLTLSEVRGLSSGITQQQFDVADKNHNGVIDCSDFLSSPEGEGTPEGVPEGQPEGVVEGTPEGTPEGVPE
ncbi:MAG TPA: hypothetical protein PK813_13050, partial [Candidatus Hydrogenedens sp.]|nr:hypothetical protein [Candidatus Hydrogenedens sp.]